MAVGCQGDCSSRRPQKCTNHRLLHMKGIIAAGPTHGIAAHQQGTLLHFINCSMHPLECWWRGWRKVQPLHASCAEVSRGAHQHPQHNTDSCFEMAVDARGVYEMLGAGVLLSCGIVYDTAPQLKPSTQTVLLACHASGLPWPAGFFVSRIGTNMLPQKTFRIHQRGTIRKGYRAASVRVQTQFRTQIHFGGEKQIGPSPSNTRLPVRKSN